MEYLTKEKLLKKYAQAIKEKAAELAAKNKPVAVPASISSPKLPIIPPANSAPLVATPSPVPASTSSIAPVAPAINPSTSVPSATIVPALAVAAAQQKVPVSASSKSSRPSSRVVPSRAVRPTGRSVKPLSRQAPAKATKMGLQKKRTALVAAKKRVSPQKIVIKKNRVVRKRIVR